ncbi:MAG: FGGY-family carbohydrate kinase, partial [Aurantimicrobium sp.]
NMVVWQDRRAESVTNRLQDKSEIFEQKTGLVLDPYFSAPKQAWIRENVTKQGVVTTSDSWLLHQLTGEFVTDVSTASRSLVTDLDTGEWDRELLSHFDLQDEKLPKILNSDEIAGVTRHFGGIMPVGGLIVDQQAALLAEKCLEVGEAKCTFGTGAFLLANTGKRAVRSSAKLAASFAWRTELETAYCFDGQVYTAASAVRWLKQMGFINAASELDIKAASHHDGIYSVPAFAGLAAPRWRPDVKASFSGITLSSEPSHFILAVLQGIAAQVAELVDLVESDMGSALKTLRVDGGLTQSAVLMQSVADLTQRTIEIYPSQHATPLGAAALARVASKSGGWIKDSVIEWAPSHVFEPKWRSEQAQEFRTAWATAADSAL